MPGRHERSPELPHRIERHPGRELVALERGREGRAGRQRAGRWRSPGSATAAICSGRPSSRARTGRSPRLMLAEASYRQVNQRPRIDRFGALDPGQILVPANFNPADQVYEPAGPNRDGIFTTLQPAAAGGDTRTKQLWKLGQRTLRWRVTDPNGDELRYALAVRTEERRAPAGCRLADDLKEDFFGFDATVLPDGRYRFRLTASDRRGNSPRGRARPRSRRASRWSSITRRRSARRAVEARDGVWRVEVTDRLESAARGDAVDRRRGVAAGGRPRTGCSTGRARRCCWARFPDSGAARAAAPRGRGAQLRNVRSRPPR